MASSSPLKDIDDKFCLCSICLEQLKEPKLLPCLHRFCKNCLKELIETSQDAFRCPECREDIHIPSNGVEGLKTDFYMKNLVEYIQIQQSLQSDERRKCYGCSKRLRVTAYCFKCNDFLCKDCHHFHVTYNILKDHKKHTLSLEDIESRNITIEKLASMQDAPMCQTHPEKISELYCETCRGLLVCMACMLGEHKGHNLHEIKALAQLKRKELTHQLKTLEQTEKNNKSIETRQAKGKLIFNARIEKEKLVEMHEEKVQKIRKALYYNDRGRVQVIQKQRDIEMDLFGLLQNEFEIEIQTLQIKYAEIFNKMLIEMSDYFTARQISLEHERITLKEKLEHLEKDKQELLDSTEKQLKENTTEIETILEHFDGIKRRVDTLNELASSVLASENDWSAVQCIPDMCTAAANIMEDLKKEFPELTTLTDVTVNYKQSSFGNPSISKISEPVEKDITRSDTHRSVSDMTCSGDGNIVLSGYTLDPSASFMIVLDINGGIIKEKIISSEYLCPYRFCDFLSQYKIATVCVPNEIGIYDIRDDSYITKNIRDVISTGKIYLHVSCIATDPANNHIFVGASHSRDVYVFDDQLNYLGILTLPEMIKWPGDITVSYGYLMVCDHKQKKAYITTMERIDNNVIGEFMQPDPTGRDFTPVSVCSDKNGFVYVLWKEDLYSRQSYLVQYIQNGSSILTKRKLDDNVNVITVAETSQGEKLVVASRYLRNFYIYDLKKNTQ